MQPLRHLACPYDAAILEFEPEHAWLRCNVCEAKWGLTGEPYMPPRGVMLASPPGGMVPFTVSGWGPDAQVAWFRLHRDELLAPTRRMLEMYYCESVRHRGPCNEGPLAVLRGVCCTRPTDPFGCRIGKSGA